LTHAISFRDSRRVKALNKEEKQWLNLQRAALVCGPSS
jgi:hypothetical protein